MKDYDIKWSECYLCSIQFSEDYWHLKVILYCPHEKDDSFVYEVEFRDCNIEQMKISGNSIMFPIKDLVHRKLPNGGYDILISFSSKYGEVINLSCSDFYVRNHGAGYIGLVDSLPVGKQTLN